MNDELALFVIVITVVGLAAFVAWALSYIHGDGSTERWCDDFGGAG